MSIDGDQIDKSGCYSSIENSDDGILEEEEIIPPPTEPIQRITELVFKDSLLYGGFCFGGTSKTLASVTHLKIWDLEVPLAEIPAKCQLNAAKLLVELTLEFQAGLDKLKAKIGKKIGCSKAFFELLFKTMLFYEAGAEVVRHKGEEMAPNQFGTLFIQPPSTHTGGEMKVYRKLDADEDEEVIHLKFGANFGTSASMWHFGFISAEAEYEIDPILSGSRLMFVFAAVWSSDQSLRFHGPDQIDQIATQLELQRANGDFLVAFLRDPYENFEGVGERALKYADRSLVRLLEAANERLEKPFKVVLVSAVLDMNINERVCDCKPGQWHAIPGEVEQQWFNLDGKPWPYKLTAHIEVMRNVLNPERKSLKQLWGSYVEEKVSGIPTLDYDDSDGDLPTYRATYRRSLLVLWPSGLKIVEMVELEGWDAAFMTLIDKSPDSAALVSLLLFYKNENGRFYRKKVLEDKTIRHIFDYIDEKNLLDAIPSYMNIFETKDAIKPIIHTSNEEVWKTSWAIFLYIFNSRKHYLKTIFDLVHEEQTAPRERRYKLLLEVIKNDVYVFYHESYLRLDLVLADDALIRTLCATLCKKRLLGHYIEKLLTPEFAPLKEKFWTTLYSILKQEINFLKYVIVKGSKPFDEHFPDLDAIFPKGSDELSWLQNPGTYSHILKFDDSKKANQVVEQLKVYIGMFSAYITESYDRENKYHIHLAKTTGFWHYQKENDSNKIELQALEKLKDEIDREPPTKKPKNK